jgi:hypothetical protein
MHNSVSHNYNKMHETSKRIKQEVYLSHNFGGWKSQQQSTRSGESLRASGVLVGAGVGGGITWGEQVWEGRTKWCDKNPQWGGVGGSQSHFFITKTCDNQPRSHKTYPNPSRGQHLQWPNNLLLSHLLSVLLPPNTDTPRTRTQIVYEAQQTMKL